MTEILTKQQIEDCRRILGALTIDASKGDARKGEILLNQPEWANRVNALCDLAIETFGKSSMTWNPDISAAPRGRFVERIITTTNGPRESMDFIADNVWLALKGGQVLRSFWVPPTAKETAGRWHGCSAKEVPLAWQPFVKPEFPSELEEAYAE